MRVISGTLKGRKLKRPLGIRPTRDFVKEALFNILGPLEGKVVYDICAGSGALGIEALSRGASKVVFIEKDKKNCEIIQSNLHTHRHLERSRDSGKAERSNKSATLDPSASLGMTWSYEIKNTPFEKLHRPFEADIIFFDPPYEEENLYQKMFALGKNTKLLVVESNHPITHDDYILQDQRHYGSTYLSFFRP